MTDRVQRMWDDRQLKYSMTWSNTIIGSTSNACGLSYVCCGSMGHGVLLPRAGATTAAATDPECKTSSSTLLIAKRATGHYGADARRIVPNEYWGWVDESPDRRTSPNRHQRESFVKRPALGSKELSRP
jgi:hypothetical protein